jgi:predicted adenine nucleotide alpha hydrolase (AANH) superfamily ATPase
LNKIKKEKLLLHACCAPCATHVIDLLSQTYNLTVLFYNPNIHPEDEYQTLLWYIVMLCDIKKTDLVIPDYETQIWFESTKGLETVPEGNERCKICFDVRFKKSAEIAAASGCNNYASTLTVSPHKDPKVINSCGRTAAEVFGVKFLEQDFKKKDGYKRSCELSRKYGLYRQNYCGCLYSIG